MYRYIIELYGNKNPMITKSISDNNLIDPSRYLQFLGFCKMVRKRVTTITFWELSEYDLTSLKGYKPVLLKRNGIPKILCSMVKSVKKEEI